MSPVPALADGSGDIRVLAAAFIAPVSCVPRAGAVGSGQCLFAAFSYLLLGKWNRVLEQSPVSLRVSTRGALPRAPVPPPSLQVTWQAGTCKNQFCTRVHSARQLCLAASGEIP